jgi:hypothetical protein
MWLAAILLFSAILVVGIAGTREEPFQWLEGISIWPTEIIRLIATVAAFVLLFRADRALRDNFKGLTTASHFNALPPKRNAGKWIWAQAWQKLLIEAPKPDSKGRVEAQSIWHHYEQSDECAVRWWRTVPLAGIVLVVTAYILKSERPILPCRGTISCGTDLVVAAVSFFILLLLTFYIADATATCNRWIRCLISVQTIWPGGEGTCSAVADDWGAPSKDLPGAWHEVEIVARRTQVVGQLILYPFSILLVLILSRSRVFDHWPWSGSLVIMFSFPLGLALISALLLRSSAEELRTKSGVEVRSLWVEAIRAEDRSKTELAETAMKSIEGESRGGFSPFTQNPVLAAILLPLTGAGTGLAIEKLIGKF